MEEKTIIELPQDESAASEVKLHLLCEAADDQKARDITVLDVRGQTIVADFFVICSGTSVTHIQSIAEGVQDKLRERARLRARKEGNAQSYWLILDYSDVILHVFDEETREFYDLERLWSDAKVSYYGSERTEKTLNQENRNSDDSLSEAADEA
jgi:ribosome-associated protein